MTPIDCPTHKADVFSYCKKRESYDRVATPNHRIERCQRPWLCRRTSIRTSSNAERDHASSCDKALEPRSHLSTPKVSITKTHSGSQAWNLTGKAPINRPARRADAKLKDRAIEQSRHSSPPEKKKDHCHSAQTESYRRISFETSSNPESNHAPSNKA